MLAISTIFAPVLHSAFTAAITSANAIVRDQMCVWSAFHVILATTIPAGHRVQTALTSGTQARVEQLGPFLKRYEPPERTVTYLGCCLVFGNDITLQTSGRQVLKNSGMFETKKSELHTYVCEIERNLVFVNVRHGLK